MSHVFTRAGIGLVATLAIGLVPAPAQAVPMPPSAVLAASAQGLHRHHRACPKVEAWSGPVTRCVGTFSRLNHRDLLTDDGIWAPSSSRH